MATLACAPMLLAGWCATPAMAQDPSVPDLRTDPSTISPLRATGTINGPTGPAQGVQVFLEVSDMRTRRPVGTLTARSDVNGEYSFDLRQFDLPDYGLEFTTSSPRYVQAIAIRIVPREELPITVDLNLQPGSIARGVVRDAQGEPLGGVTIGGSNLATQRSLPTGEFEVFGIPVGRMDLSFSKEGYAQQFFPFAVDSPQIVDGLEVVLQSAREFLGRVVDPNGKPVPYATVMLSSATSHMRQEANAQGEFAFRGVPKELAGLELRVQGPDFLPTEYTLAAEHEDAERHDFIARRGVRVMGSLHLPGGTPAASARVSVTNPLNGDSFSTRSSSDGRWTLGPFEPGSPMWLIAEPPSVESTWGIADLVLERGDGADAFKGGVEIWPKGFSSTFTGTYRDGQLVLERIDSGEGGLGAPATYRAGWDGQAETMSGLVSIPALRQDGTFTMKRRLSLGDGPAGEWELREELGPSALSLSRTHRYIQLGHMTGRYRVALELKESQPLTGHVVDADGNPVEQGMVFIGSWDLEPYNGPPAEIGVGGRFSFDHPPDGLLEIFAETPDGYTAFLPCRGGDEITLQLGADGTDPIEQ